MKYDIAPIGHKPYHSLLYHMLCHLLLCVSIYTDVSG